MPCSFGIGELQPEVLAREVLQSERMSGDLSTKVGADDELIVERTVEQNVFFLSNLNI